VNDIQLRYADFVDYDKLDPVKRLALELFEPTLKYPERLGISIIPESLGQTAVAFNIKRAGKDWHLSFNVEGLGTKNLVADGMYREVLVHKRRVAEGLNVRGLYRGLGKDTAAMSINDTVATGADPFAYCDLLTCGNSEWFSCDTARVRELLQGYRDAADEAKFAIPQGETPELRDVVNPETLDLAGASVGIVRPRSRFMSDKNIRTGDIIYGLSSSGIHANGLSKARKLAEKLPDGYFEPLGDGQTLGQALLVPTVLYARPVIDAMDLGAHIHFMQPITGHGWEKIARARRPFTYRIKEVPEPPLLFRRLTELGGENGFDVSQRENYFTWNMGVGWVMMARAEDEQAIRDAARKHNLQVWALGKVEEGPRRVIMPFNDAEGKQVEYVP
jgi:phosphoribosylformylglycinamidine cyclo-ligase